MFDPMKKKMLVLLIGHHDPDEDEEDGDDDGEQSGQQSFAKGTPSRFPQSKMKPYSQKGK